MRITFLSPPPNLSGGQRVIAIYARELIKLGHDVSIVCCGPRTIPFLAKFKTLLKGKGRPTDSVPFTSHYKNYGVPHWITKDDREISFDDIPNADVLISTFWTTAILAHRLPQEKGQKFYLVQHDEGTMWPDSRAEDTYAFPLRQIYVSQWIADRIRSRHPYTKGIVINNAIDANDFDLGKRGKPNRLQLGMMWAKEETKGSDVAIDAISLARRRGLELDLIAFGIKPPPKELQNVFDTFLVCPSPKQLAEIYGSCTAWLFTSRFEGFGLPILEAMAARTPVIGTPTGAAPDLIGQGGGILVPMDDPIATADAIEQLDGMSADEWSSMSNAAYRTASSCTWTEAASRFERYIASEGVEDS